MTKVDNFIIVFMIFLVGFYFLVESVNNKFASQSLGNDDANELRTALKGMSYEQVLNYLKELYGEENVMLVPSLIDPIQQILADNGYNQLSNLGKKDMKYLA